MTHASLSQDPDVVPPSAPFLPLVGSLLVTGAVAALACQPLRQSYPLQILFALAAIYIAIAAIAHATTVWLVQRLFEEVNSLPVKAVMTGLWSTVAWLPLLALLTSEDSPWVAATLPLITVFAVRFIRRYSYELDTFQNPASHPFLPDGGLPFWRAMLPSAFASATLGGGAIALALQHTWLAGTLFSASLSWPVWKLLSAPEVHHFDGGPMRFRALLRNSALAWVLTTTALLPFARSGPIANALVSLGVKRHPGVHTSTRPKEAVANGKSALGFVVLLQPRRPQKRVPPPPDLFTAHSSSTAPTVIPFDGPYWFFKHAGDRPGVTARRERGEPRKVIIRSTDGLPMLMEAQQPFAPPINLSSARVLRVQIENADDRPGVIYVEVLLKGHSNAKTSTISLGTQPLASSQTKYIPLGRAPIQESLLFALPIVARMTKVDGIVVRFKPDSSRNLAAPMVAVREFLLSP